MGVGGLGHLGIQWSKALGAETYVLTHSPDKEKDAKSLGAKEVIVTTKDDWTKDYQFRFDFILNCTDATDKMDVPSILKTLNIGGQFHIVGIGNSPLPQLPPGAFTANNAKITGSHIGNRQEMQALLKLAADKGIAPMVETVPISEKGCKDVVERVNNNKVRYRFTLTDFDKAFKA